MLARRIPDKNIWTIYGAILTLGVAYGTSIAVLAIHLDRHGIPKLAMGGLAAAFALGIASFALPAGFFVERFGAKRTLACALVGYAACVTCFPFLATIAGLSVARFFDGAFSAAVWVSAETALLSRSSESNKAFVMSLYAMCLALGYVIGPLVAMGIVHVGGTGAAFVVAGGLAIGAAVWIVVRLEAGTGTSTSTSTGASGERSAPMAVLWRVKTSCLATFSYGYFQASVVLFLPLYLIEEKHVEEKQTILITAFFALGMLVATTWVSRLGDRHGHLVVMRVLAAIGGLMVASFVLLGSFPAMCGAVFVAGATLASISPVSLALQGIVTAPADLGRANALYNASYAAGMLVGPPLTSWLFTKYGGGPMLFHLAGLWALFVSFTVVFAGDDPRRRALAKANATMT